MVAAACVYNEYCTGALFNLAVSGVEFSIIIVTRDAHNLQQQKHKQKKKLENSTDWNSKSCLMPKTRVYIVVFPFHLSSIIFACK